MSVRAEARKRWEAFVGAFSALGDEARGMSPAAACVLMAAAAEYDNDPATGFRPLLTGVPECAIFSEEHTITIPDAYMNCPEFWEIDSNFLRAKVTEEGVAYVRQHGGIFKLLIDQE